MPDIDIHVKSRFTINGRNYGAPHLNSYDCRELAVGYMVGEWQAVVRDVARRHINETDFYNSSVICTLFERAIKPAKLRLTVLFEERHWDTIPDRLRADVNAFIKQYYGIQLQYRKRVHLIDDSSWWERSVQRLQGYNIVGDARCIPAFFWSVFFFRSWMEAASPHEYTDFDRFAHWCFDNEDSDEFYGVEDDDGEQEYYGHLEAYNTLVGGREPPASLMLALACGPIDAFAHARRYEDRVAYIEARPILSAAINRVLREV